MLAPDARSANPSSVHPFPHFLANSQLGGTMTLMFVFRTTRWAAAAAIALVTLGCAGVRPYRANFASDDANERILAIKAAGDAKDVQAVPLLVDRLEDEDSAVRFFAIIALEKITGRRFGYDYSQPSREREASIVRWRQYVKTGEFAAATPAPAPPQGSSLPAGANQSGGIAAGP